MDKYFVLGAKKLLSLTKTKIRLAKEADTNYTRPAPLPLIKHLSGNIIGTVSEAEEYREKLLKEINYSNEKSVADTVFFCMDLIEGVKYKYEPPEYCFNLSAEELAGIEKASEKDNIPVNILVMTQNLAPKGINLFVGENPPQEAYHISGVPTSLAEFVYFALNSKHFYREGRIHNINCFLGRQTLINKAITYALYAYGADLTEQNK